MPGELDAFARLMIELREIDRDCPFVQEAHLERILTGFGSNTRYIASAYKLYQNHLAHSVNIVASWDRLVGETEGDLEAFALLIEERKVFSPNFPLLKDVHLQRVLQGFGKPARQLSTAYKLYRHYLRNGTDIVQRYDLIREQTRGDLDALKLLRTELPAASEQLVSEGVGASWGPLFASTGTGWSSWWMSLPGPTDWRSRVFPRSGSSSGSLQTFGRSSADRFRAPN